MKVISTLSIFIITIIAAHAQSTIAPVVGINFSGTIGGESYTNYDRDYGWKAGALMQVPLGKKYLLCPELLFDAKSYKNNTANIYSVNNVVIPAYFYDRLIFGYVEAPFTLQRNFSSGFHAGAGVFAGYQISQRRNETVEYEVEVHSIVTDLTSTSVDHEITAERFQFGVQAGIGYVKSGFDLSLTSQYHLTPLYNSSTDAPKKLHFFNLSLGLAYHFQLAKKTSAT